MSNEMLCLHVMQQPRVPNPPLVESTYCFVGVSRCASSWGAVEQPPPLPFSIAGYYSKESVSVNGQNSAHAPEMWSFGGKDECCLRERKQVRLQKDWKLERGLGMTDSVRNRGLLVGNWCELVWNTHVCTLMWVHLRSEGILFLKQSQCEM